MSMNYATLVSPYDQSTSFCGGLKLKKVSFSMRPSILGGAKSSRVAALNVHSRNIFFNPFLAANHQPNITDVKVFEDLQHRKGLQCSRRNAVDRSMTSGGEYEVFLSFRGDERKRFVDHLYCSLEEVGVRAFRDKEEILEGENIGGKILAAISSSRVCIPILSKGYADSAWCLRELAHMVECSKSTAQLVILPIFLDVDPSEVKLYQGSYVDALRKHGIRFDPKTVKQWEDALKQVGKIKGWELAKEVNGHEGALIKLVVRKVLLSLKVHRLNVSDQLVAIDDHVAKLTRLLNLDSDDVRIVGIYGMGGIGKTTLAKVVYNRLSTFFESCCFLADVRETSEISRGVESLQNQLISNILKNKCPDISNIDEGINIIKERFSSKKVLILLDDVDKSAQLTALAGKRSWFGSGSRIIITTRNIDVLNVPEVDWKHEMTVMDFDQSMQLFCRHAFRRDHPSDEYLDYSKKAVEITGGLPLALENIGSFLSTKKKQVWESTLKKLEQVPRDEVDKKLRISYEALDHWQKQIFLDIASMFIGFDKRIAIHLWDNARFFPEEGIEVLMLMSMIKIGDDNKLWMHDQLRDLGRKIVLEENEIEPGKRSRLWDHEDSLNMLIRKKGTEMVQALCLKFDSKSQYYFTREDFQNLSNLRFLQVNGVNLAGNFEGLFSQLRWLCWHYCPSHFLPTNFHLQNLAILDLSWSKISEDWKGWHHIKMATDLKVLNLTGCTNMYRNPDLSFYAALERLIFEGCESLVGIDSSIGSLKHLLSLNIKDCGCITELPEELGSCEALTELLIDGTSIQEISISPGCLKKLEILSARDCKSLTRVNSSIYNLESLTDLALDNAKIKHLPDPIGMLSRLERLSLNGCRSISNLPDSIGQLESLLELDLSNTGITQLPDSIKSLRNLKVLKVEGSYLEGIPQGVGMLENLEEIHAKGCSLEGDVIPSVLGKLSYLKVLSLSDNRISSIPESISTLSYLETLDLELCKDLQTLPELPPSLVNLRFSSSSMERIPDLSNLTNLKHLYLSDGSNLPTDDPLKLVQNPSLWWLGTLAKLETLQLSLSKITSLPGNILELSRLKKLVLSCVDLKCLVNLPSSLSTLYIGNCKSMTTLSGLSNLENLTELELLHSAISEVRGLEGLKSLKVFDVIYCKLEKLDGLEKLESLGRLILRNCEELQRLPDVSNLKKLKEFKLRDCRNLRKIEGLDKLGGSLEQLQIDGCASLESLPDLSGLKNLTSLEIKKCEKVIEIRGLEGMESLEELEISECSSLEKLPELRNLKKLKVLKIESCEKIDNISGLGLEGLESCLEMLRIIGCKALHKLPDLSNFSNLKSLDIDDCEKIRDTTAGLELLRSIRGDNCF